MIERPSVGGPRRIGPEGEVEVFVADEQDAVAVDVERWAALATAVLHDEGVRGAAELSLAFVAEADMADLNQRFMGHDGPTDVLAFPIDEVGGPQGVPLDVRDGEPLGPDRPPVDTGDLPLLLGDVLVCPAVAGRQAPEHAGTLDDELALLVVHGTLHVLGWDHATPDETAAMRSRERALLEAHHWRAPAPPGFRQDHTDPDGTDEVSS